MIIGIVAAITLPSIISFTNDLQYKVALKKNYSVLKQAIRLVQINDYEDLRNFEYKYSLSTTTAIYSLLKKYLNVVKYCGHDDMYDCWPDVVYRYPGKISNNFTKTWMQAEFWAISFVLDDGTAVIISVIEKDGYISAFKIKEGILGERCLKIWIDTNGQKGPNMHGKDIHMFGLTQNGLVPAGINNTNSYGCNRGKNSNNTTCTALMLK